MGVALKTQSNLESGKVEKVERCFILIIIQCALVECTHAVTVGVCVPMLLQLQCVYPCCYSNNVCTHAVTVGVCVPMLLQ